jgi:geranylgeranyl diphosphate synthase, type II
VTATACQTIQSYLEEQRARVDAELDRLMPPASDYPPSIHQAMRHSVFAGGKRIRPILCLEAGRLLGGDEASLSKLGCAIEFIHTYSLIHDDLPALDNDDLRRGKPTCHVAFGEATAILAGDALLTLAFETLSAPAVTGEARRLRVLHELSTAIGTRGMIGGQVVDLEASGRAPDPATLEYIHSAKTGALIRAAARSGAIYAGAADADLDRVTSYGERVGLAFQVADDLLDVSGSAASLGKTPGKDGRQKKLTYPAVHGVEAAKRIAAQLAAEAQAALETYGDRARRLNEIARYLVSRET